MAGRSRLTVSSEQEAALKVLARSEIRGEADRARAIRLTIEGWTSGEIAAAFGVTAASVRHWRHWFASGGVTALRSSIAPGPSPAKGDATLAIACEVLTAPVENRPPWTLSR